MYRLGNAFAAGFARRFFRIVSVLIYCVACAYAITCDISDFCYYLERIL